MYGYPKREKKSGLRTEIKNCGFLSWDRIHIQNSLVNKIYALYSCTLIGENNVRISKEREKEWIKD